MGVFRQFPYSNFHEMNMDEIIKIVKSLIEDWAELNTDMEQYKNDIDSAIAEFRHWFDNLDIDAEVRNAVNTKINAMINSGQMALIIQPYVSPVVTSWLENNITEPTGVVIDESLTVRGACADAKSAGKIRSELSGLYGELSFSTHSGYVNNTNGAFVDGYEGWTRTNYIAVNAFDPLYIVSEYVSNYNAIYDENYTFIKAFSIQTGSNKIVLPINAKYIAISGADPFIDGWYGYYWIAKQVNGVSYGQFEPNNNFAMQRWYNGSLDSNGDYIESNVRLVTDFIPVGGNFEIHGEVWSWPIIIAEYDSNKICTYMQNYYYENNFHRILRPDTAFVRMVTFDGSNPSRELIATDIAFSRLFLERRYIPSNILKVATYNVGGYHYGTGYGIPNAEYNEKLIGWRRTIAKINADVLGMQEYDTRMDEANTIWSDDVLWNHFYGYEETTGSQTALKSKPIFSYHYIGTLSTGRYYCYGYIAGIFIISVHLTVGAGDASVRLTEAQEIINIVSPHNKFIIMGDFNPEVGEEDILYKKFTDAGMKLCNCGFFGKYYTWSSNRDDFNDYENPTGTLWYVDNIIVSNNIDILNAYPMPEAYRMASSDHIPFIAELKVGD